MRFIIIIIIITAEYNLAHGGRYVRIIEGQIGI